MPSVLAIISKAQFEAAHPRAKEGDVLGFSQYVSTHAALSPLNGGGSLFLVTVRPPDERLWLIGELEAPTHDGKAWKSPPSTLAVSDVTETIPRLRFATGKGLAPKKGALGMSLQTPRQLTDDDVALLRGSAAAPAVAQKTPKPLPSPQPTPPARTSAPNPDDALRLSAVLSEWRATRAPELEALIDTLSAHFVRAWPPLDPTADDYDARWNERAKQLCPENLPTLIPGLWSDPKGAIPLRVRLLIELGPDPRLGEGLLTMIDDPPFTASSNFSAWSAVFKALPTMVDARAKKRLEARQKKKGGASQFWPKLNGWISTALAQLTAPAALDEQHAASVTSRRRIAEALLEGPPPAAIGPAPKQQQRPSSFTNVSSALEAALTAAQEARFLDALEPLRHAWETTREPALAAAMTRLDALGSLGQERFDLGKATEAHAAWVKAAERFDARRVAPLLAALFSHTHTDSEARLKLMTAWPADPRVAERLVDTIRNSYGSLGPRAMIWKRVYELLVQHADPRHATFLEANAARLEHANTAYDRNRAEGPHAVATIQPFLARARAQIALTPAEQTLLTTLQDTISRAESSKKASASPDRALALLQAINAAPDELTPRLVYADFLAERGDPRAEFINLAVALARGEKVKGAYEACAKKLGILKALPNYHLGLVVKRGTDAPRFANDLERANWVEDVSWASVRELRAGSSASAPDSPIVAEVLARAPLYGVKQLSAKAAAVACAANRDFPWLIERIELFDTELPAGASTRPFPHLETVRVSLYQPLPLGLFTQPLLSNVRVIEGGGPNVYGPLPVDALLIDGVTLPRLEAISLITSAMDFEATVSAGGADVRFVLKSQPRPTDDYFLATLERLKAVPAALVRSFTFEAQSGLYPVNLKSLELAKAATQHLTPAR